MGAKLTRVVASFAAMIHPDTELRHISPRMGRGVVATRLIPRGTIVWAKDDLDQVISFKRFRKLPRDLRDQLDEYAYLDVGGFVLCWDLARFVNHSCDPNCLAAGYDFEVAVRDIQPGEELTGDYGAMNPDSVFDCLCGLVSCRREILPDDLVTHAKLWDKRVKKAFARMRDVAQPLWPLVDAWEKKHVEKVLAGKRKMISCRENYLGPMPELETLWDGLD